MKRFIIIAFVISLSVSLFGCGASEKEISDLSVLKDGANQYDLTFEEIADIVDEYIELKHPIKSKFTYGRGDESYIEELEEITKNQELKDLPEWNAIQIYCTQYSSANVAGAENLELDDDNLLPEFTDRTVNEYVNEVIGGKPEDLL